jgi:hypothetical protein
LKFFGIEDPVLLQAELPKTLTFTLNELFGMPVAVSDKYPF